MSLQNAISTRHPTGTFFFVGTEILIKPSSGHFVSSDVFCFSSLILQAFCDIEPIYTFEGTYDINTLVTGREITGFASFKPVAQKSRL